MTDLGRGYGPQGAEPWHPGDPAYGGQQDGQWQQYPQQGYPQQEQYQQQMAQQQMGHQGFQDQGFDQQGYGQQGFPGGQGQYPQQGQYAQQGQFPQQGQYQQMPQQQMGQQGFPQQGQYPQQQMGQQGFQQQGYPQQQMQQPPVQQAPVPQQQMPPQMQQQQTPRQAAQQVPQQAEPASGPGPDGIDWEAEAAALEAGADPVAGHEPAEEEWDDHFEDDRHEDGHHGDDGYLEEDGEHGEAGFLGEEDGSREAQKKRKEKGKKSGRRNSGACLLVALVLLGAMGGAGWWGYGFYKDHFGPPPDFTGDGTGSVQVEVKQGAVGAQVGLALKNAGVVKSVDAFSKACDAEPKCNTVQPGFYTLKKEMPAADALKALLAGAGGDGLVIPEGKTAADIYGMIDNKLKLTAGTTAGVAKAQVASLGLPAYANGNIEGFLWPTRYNVADGMKPEDLLKQMVKAATDKYANLDAQASKVGLKNAYEVVIEASILQREGNNVPDFAKMARTIQNRLANDTETHHKLGMDTTLQYSLGRTELSSKDINDGSNKYNTYINQGLPPTPISNPGDAAINAVLNPADGKWLYFIAMSPTTTLFAETGEEHKKNVEAYCTQQGLKLDKEGVHCTK